jgi:hypothetical protein
MGLSTYCNRDPRALVQVTSKVAADAAPEIISSVEIMASLGGRW